MTKSVLEVVFQDPELKRGGSQEGSSCTVSFHSTDAGSNSFSNSAEPIGSNSEVSSESQKRNSKDNDSCSQKLRRNTSSESLVTPSTFTPLGSSSRQHELLSDT